MAIFLAAGAFVAITVITREEPKFMGKQIVHPKMKLQKLQVPVEINKQLKQTPKLSQRVTAQARVNTKAGDFKLPDVAGFGGGGSVSVSGAGLSGSLGFAVAQLNLFGLKSSGEKVVFLLDTQKMMLLDERGGIAAYKIIKNEILNLINGLPPTTLFNVLVFDRMGAGKASLCAFSKELQPANSENKKKINEWLKPLNSEKETFGLKTLPYCTFSPEFERMAPIYNIQNGWPAGLSYAMQKGADSIYWLGAWDSMADIDKKMFEEAKSGKPLEDLTGRGTHARLDYETYGREKWDALVARARKMNEEENARRRKRGEPIRVLRTNGEESLVKAYIPGVALPVQIGAGPIYRYTPSDIAEYLKAMNEKYNKSYRTRTIGLRKTEPSLNVIYFELKAGVSDPGYEELNYLDRVAPQMNGKVIKIQGLDAIKSAATATPEDL